MKLIIGLSFIGLMASAYGIGRQVILHGDHQAAFKLKTFEMCIDERSANECVDMIYGRE